jgi:hypothetical protein
MPGKSKKGKPKAPQYSPKEQETLDWMHEQAFRGAGSPGYTVRPLVEKHDLGVGMPPAYDMVMERPTPGAVPQPAMPQGVPLRSEFMKGYIKDHEKGMLVPLAQYRKEAGMDGELREGMAYMDSFRREALERAQIEKEREERLQQLDQLYSRYRGAPGSAQSPDVMPHVKKLKERTKAKVKESGGGGSRNTNPKTSLGVRG